MNAHEPTEVAAHPNCSRRRSPVPNAAGRLERIALHGGRASRPPERVSPGQASACKCRRGWASTARNTFDDRGVELRPGAAPELGQRVGALHRAPVRAVGGHRVPGVADRDHARAERDRVAGEAVGVAAAVEALVARAHELRDVGQRRRGGQDALADERVAAHERPLVLVQRPGLVEDRVGDGELADVVQLGALADRAHHVDVEPEPVARCARRARRPRRRGRRGSGCARGPRAVARPWTGCWPTCGRRACARTCGGRRSPARRRPCAPRRAARPCRPRR